MVAWVLTHDSSVMGGDRCETDGGGAQTNMLEQGWAII